MNAGRISLLCLLTAAVATLLLPPVAIGADKDKEEGGVKAVDDAWQTAIIKGDVEAVVACYADDAILWTPHDPEAKGKDAIREVFKRMLENMKVTEIRVEDAHYHTAGDRSVGWGTFTITIKAKDGSDEQTVRGRFTEVAEKRGGKWVYVVDHASAEEK